MSKENALATVTGPAAVLQRVTAALEQRIGAVEDLLPDFMKGQGKRIVARARQYWARGDYKLQQCTPASFVACVMGAAELGFTLDGRMCHAVPFNTKVKGPGGDHWESKAQLIVDYKGLLAVAKRHKLIQDGWARVVLKSDTFRMSESDGEPTYSYEPNLDASRDKLDNARGVLAVATHANGWFRLEWMPIDDVYAVRNRSKGYSPDKPNTPWHTDPGEMAKKTALKRLLKTFTDDPGLLRAMELDDDKADDDREETAVMQPQLMPGRPTLMPAKREAEAIEDAGQVEPYAPDYGDANANAEVLAENPIATKEPATVSNISPAAQQESDDLDQLLSEIGDCKTPDEVARVMATAPTDWTPEHVAKASELAEKRCAALKPKRGERSNKQNRLLP